MSLQDEHLKTALRHASDQDFAPSQGVRESILNYANDAVKPAPENWLKRALSAFANWRVNSWQVAGMGALASVLLVVVMVREQVPQETIWSESTVEDLAQNKVEATAAATSEIEQEAAKREVSPSVAAPAQQNMPMPMERAEPKAKDALTKEVAPAEVAIAEETPAKPLAEKTEMAASPPVMADKAEVTAAAEAPEAAVVASAPASVASTSIATSAEADAQLGRAKTAPAMRKLDIKNDGIVEKLLTQGGAYLAKQDIAAGNFRMLKLEIASCDKLAKHDALDATTNYKIEVISACDLDANVLQKEVDVYNQAMLNWQQNLKQ